jgi:hypothetical protein
MDDARIQASSGYWTFIEDGEQRTPYYLGCVH